MRSILVRVPMTVVLYAWAFPATLVGLAVALFARAGGASVAVAEGVIEVAGGRLGEAVSRFRHPFCFNAITFGHVIFAVDPRLLAECRAHERVHVRQYERWGVLFFVLYAGSSIFEALRGGDPYWDNHFERQARVHAAHPHLQPEEHS